MKAGSKIVELVIAAGKARDALAFVENLRDALEVFVIVGRDEACRGEAAEIGLRVENGGMRRPRGDDDSPGWVGQLGEDPSYMSLVRASKGLATA